MHRKSIVILAMIAVTLLTIVPAFAVKPDGPASSNGLKRGKNDHLYLFEKDPETWEIVEDPAWAKMNINLNKNKFVYNAHGLTPETDYELICYLDPWPGEGSLLLGSATSDENGNAHIKGTINVAELPASSYDLDGDTVDDVTGSKIWLVLAEDFELNPDSNEIGTMVNWNPTQYLFEYDLLTSDN